MIRGFTLIELLVAITLLSFLGGSGLVAYRQSARKQAVEAAYGKIKTALRQSQGKAASGVKNKTVCGVNPLKGWQVTFTASDMTTAGVCEGAGGTVVFDSVTESYSPFFTGITVTALPSPNPIVFGVLNRGTNIQNSTSLTLSGWGVIRSISISRDGQIQ